MKEQFEWIHSWSDEADKQDLPRVALIGDSITYGYQTAVRELLRGKCYVDFLATSYAVDTKMYNLLVETFVADNRYDAIHFNHGLHGKHMSAQVYEQKITDLLQKIEKMSNAKIILATTTAVREENSEEFDLSWTEKVTERNEVAARIAEKRNYGLDRLHDLSVTMSAQNRNKDGFHYNENGYALFAERVAASVSDVL